MLFLSENDTTNLFISKYNVSQNRYEMLFSYDNSYGIFRAKEFVRDLCSSQYYDLIEYSRHDSNSTEEVLSDILYSHKCGISQLRINDVVCIKINGLICCFRFCGISKKRNMYKTFLDIPGFLESEKTHYIKNIHKENLVLSVLDGNLFRIDELDIKRINAYCIENETFVPSSRAGIVESNYSLYALRGTDIRNINPYRRPFVLMSNALYMYYKNRKRNLNSLLLFDKYELEMLKDYWQLHDLKLIV